ncbi:MAG: hypothetical protein RLZZ546_2109 [Bacteroidota bacterium]|jgi:biopolymer transport protein ExbD
MNIRARYNKGHYSIGQSPQISTVSLPDIVFMLLFFFMVVTKLRNTELKLALKKPNADQATKIESKTLINYIYVGKPLPQYAMNSEETVIQLGDKFAQISDIPEFIKKHKLTVIPEQHGQITTSLRIDKNVKMNVVKDIKIALRKSDQLKLSYSVDDAKNTK